MALISKHLLEFNNKVALNLPTALKLTGVGLLGFALIYCGYCLLFCSVNKTV
jgi:hypothetical protein